MQMTSEIRSEPSRVIDNNSRLLEERGYDVIFSFRKLTLWKTSHLSN